MTEKKNYTYTTPGNRNLRIPTNEESHRRFSGIIYETDFDYPTSLTEMASRIASNRKFDQRCKRDRECYLRKKNKNLGGIKQC